jgi:hypothetical protein
MEIGALAVLAVLAAINLAVSLLVARAPAYTSGQKVVQITGIWLLPIIGAVVAWGFLRENTPDPVENPHPDEDDHKMLH